MLPRFLRSALDSVPLSSSLPDLSFYLSFPLHFYLSFFIFYLSFPASLSRSPSLPLPLPLAPIFPYSSSPPHQHCLTLSLFRYIPVSVALTILLPSWRFRKSSLPATARSIPQRSCFSKISETSARLNR